MLTRMRALLVSTLVLGLAPFSLSYAQTPENDETLAKGKLIFEETAGSIGCAACHGMDGSGNSAPANAGANLAMVTQALQNVEDMSSLIKLNAEEIKAVVAYLKYLEDTPEAKEPAAAAATPDSDEELARGKVLFEETAGGIGCAVCHGIDGGGDAAPANAGADAAKVNDALQGVEDMTMIKLRHSEVKAITAYLKYLGEHPNGG